MTATHFIDRILRLLSILLTLLASAALLIGISSIFEAIGVEMPSWINVCLFIISLLGIASLRDVTLMKAGGLFDELSAFLYVRLFLNVKIKFKDIRAMANLFVPNITGKWWPMKEIKKIPKTYREEAFIELAYQILDENPSLRIK